MHNALKETFCEIINHHEMLRRIPYKQRGLLRVRLRIVVVAVVVAMFVRRASVFLGQWTECGTAGTRGGSAL